MITEYYDQIDTGLLILGVSLFTFTFVFFVFTYDKFFNKWSVLAIVFGVIGFAAIFYYPLFMLLALVLLVIIIMLLKEKKSLINILISSILALLIIFLFIVSISFIGYERKISNQNKDIISLIESGSDHYKLFDSILYHGSDHHCNKLSKRIPWQNCSESFINHLKLLENRDLINSVIIDEIDEKLKNLIEFSILNTFESNIKAKIDSISFNRSYIFDPGLIPKNKLVEVNESKEIAFITRTEYNTFKQEMSLKSRDEIKSIIDSIEYLIYLKPTNIEACRYTVDGAIGYRVLLHLYTVKLNSKQIIGYDTIMGPMPPKHVETLVWEAGNPIYGAYPTTELSYWLDSHVK